MGGSEDGDGKGANGYGVTGMADGPEESRGELLIPEEDKLGKLDVDVTEGDDKGLDGEDEGSAEARAAARRMRTRRTTWIWSGGFCGLVGRELGKGLGSQGESLKGELYRSATCSGYVRKLGQETRTVGSKTPGPTVLVIGGVGSSAWYFPWATPTSVP
ncbi:hypothetical protein BJV77DRAFT_1133659 [Russula vinacea]|nr:hypothetical protein BJV77DRAFT_1133659 [Russula vinacea]